MNVNKEDIMAALPRCMGKHNAIWVARYDTLRRRLFRAWAPGPNSPYELGVVRLCTSVVWDARQVTVEPPTATLMDPTYKLVSAGTDEATKVVTMLLEDLHQPCRVWEAMRAMLRR